MYSPFHSHFPTLAPSLVHCLSYLTFIIVASCLFCNFYFIALYICVWVFDFIFAPPPAMSLQPYINATYIRLCLLVCFILHGVSVVNPCLVSFLACLVLQHDFCNLFYFITISAFLLLQSRYSLAAKMSLFNRLYFLIHFRSIFSHFLSLIVQTGFHWSPFCCCYRCNCTPLVSAFVQHLCCAHSDLMLILFVISLSAVAYRYASSKLF